SSKVNPKVSIVLSSTSAGDIVGLISCVKVAARTNQTKLTTKFPEKCATRTMYKQKGIRCSDAPAKSTTGSMDKLAKGTSYSGAPPNSPAGIYFTYVTSDLEPYVVGHKKLINRQHPKSIQFSRVMASANFFTIGYSRRWFYLWLSREERKTAFSGNQTRTHVNSVVVVHEKKYSLEELQTMVDDMDYGLRLTIRTVSRRVL
ncbi:LOW QUALITY PROTEIN: hypothetical protein HID58_047936, partial [Brassica napus]